MNEQRMVAGVGAALAVCVATATAAAARDRRWLATLATGTVAAVGAVAAADADRRARALHGQQAQVRRDVRSIAREQQRLRTELRQLLTPEIGGPGGPRASDLYGTVRLLQEQHVGRLDQMQDSIDEILRSLRER